MEPDVMFAHGAIRTPPEILDSAQRYVRPSDREVLPTTFSLNSSLPPVRNQKSQNACVAFAACSTIDYFAFESRGYEDDFAEQFIYNCRNNYPDPGMHIYDAVAGLIKRGVPPEEVYPYLKSTGDISTIPKPVFDAALPWRIKSFAVLSTRGVPNTIDDLKSAIMTNGPCPIAFPMYNTKPYFWRDPTGSSPPIGGHAVSVVGWDAEGFDIRNSWGSGWNGNGHTKYPYTDWGAHWEIWTLIDNPDIHPPAPIPPTPSPDTQKCGCGCIQDQCSTM